MGPKTFPRYGVPIWSLWPNIRFVSSIVAEKNVHKYQLSRQTGMTGQKTLPTIWHTYMKPVTKYQISALDRHLGRTDRGKTVYLPPPPGNKKRQLSLKTICSDGQAVTTCSQFFFSQQLLLWTLQSIIASTDLLTSWLERIIRATKLKFHGFLCVLHSYFYHCNFPATK